MFRKLAIVFAATAAVAALAAIRPAPALADFTVCNQSGEHVSVAIAYHDADDDTWVARGWWNLDNGECKTPVGGDLKDQYYYLFGNGDQHVWTGSHEFCVDDNNAFTLSDADTSCSYTNHKFFEVDTGEDTSFTYTFR
jgi:uncharacterized membrane protein